jgi:hypothetical protein
VEQGDRSSGRDQIHRDAVGDCDGEQDVGCGRDPAVDPLVLNPAGAALDGHHLSAMDLIAEDHRAEFCHPTAEGEPAAHHLADRLVAPES